MLRLAIIILIAFLPAVQALAQPAVDIYWDENDRKDTVVDFGVTLVDRPVLRSLVIENLDSRPIAIPIDLSPFFVLSNDPSIGSDPLDPNVEEFAHDAIFPLVVPAGEKRLLTLRFRALPGPLLPPDIVNQVLLDLRVVYDGQPDGPNVGRRFTLRGLKTTRILASTDSDLSFDSVYIAPTPAPPDQRWIVSNVLDQPVPVLSQDLVVFTSQTAGDEFDVPTLTNPVFGPQRQLTWTAQYRPNDRGRDSAHFRIAYRPQPTSDLDTVEAILRGIGVEQQLRIIAAQGSPTAVTVRGDTVDFGRVLMADGPVSATIHVRNTGNLVIGYTGEQTIGLSPGMPAFSLGRLLGAGNTGLRVGDTDTLMVRFEPTSAGDFRATYILQTDLRGRDISGIPDGAHEHRIVLLASALRPQPRFSPASVAMGTIVYLPSCGSEAERTVELRNVGNAELVVDSVTVSGNTDDIDILPQQIRIPSGTTHSFTLRFRPTQIGERSAIVLFHTNIPGPALQVGVSASIVPADTIATSLPAVVRAKPGTPISVPIVVPADRVGLAGRASLVMSYNPTLLRFRSLRTVGSASEGALVPVSAERDPGELHVELRTLGSFIERDTLVWLEFDTFLGSRAATEIAITDDGVTFGNVGCADVLDVRATSGRFEIDSVCGLDYKTVSVQPLTASIFPNPAREQIALMVGSSASRNIDIHVVDAFGRELTALQRAVGSGLSQHFIDLSDWPVGAYSVVVKSGLLIRTVPLRIVP
jgi:Secretion system C-terminal sorting domain